MDKIFTYINEIVNRSYVNTESMKSFHVVFVYIIACAFGILMASMILGIAASAKKGRVYSIFIALFNLVLPLAMVYTVYNFSGYRNGGKLLEFKSFEEMINLFKADETFKTLLIVAGGELVINLLSLIFVCILAGGSNKGLAALSIILYVIKFFALPALPFVIYMIVDWSYITASIQYLYFAGVCAFMFLAYFFLAIGVASKNNTTKKLIVGVKDLFKPVVEYVEEQEDEEVIEEQEEAPAAEENEEVAETPWN